MAQRIAINPKYVGSSLEEVKQDLLKHRAFRLEWESREMARKLAELAHEMRVEAGLSQAQLAEKLGVSQPVIARLESKRPDRVPTFDTLARVAEACGRKMVVSFHRRAAAHGSQKLCLGQ